MFVDQMAEGVGNIACWGFSPSINLPERFYSISNANEKIEKLNLLLVGCCDSRHIVKSVADNLNAKPKFINFFISDFMPETYARIMIQLSVILEDKKRLSLEEKCEVYLEIFGNLLVRDFTASYIRQAANKFINFITSFDSIGTPPYHLNISSLKFKERDILESIFKFWRQSDDKNFEILKCWDQRLRKHLGSRYDAIPNVFDWDCSITLHDRKAEQIDTHEYSRWRHHGIAFELRQADYNRANRTLASGRPFKTKTGETNIYWGYWGDIVCSPFLCFGIDTEHCHELERKVNGKLRYGATTTSEVNVRRMLWQLETHQPCPIRVAAPFLDVVGNDEKARTEVDNLDGKIGNEGTEANPDHPTITPNAMQVSQEVTKDKPNQENRSNEEKSLEERLDSIPYEPLIPPVPFTVNYLPLNSFTDLPTRYRSLLRQGDSKLHLNVIYIGCSMAHLLGSDKLKPMWDQGEDKGDTVNRRRPTSGLLSLLDLGDSYDEQDENALLIVESVLYMVEIRPAQIEAYVDRIIQMTKALGFRPAFKPKPLEDHHLYFVPDRTQT
ncbi:UPF0470 protein C19orf51 [Fasciola gigantica]|uniref:UPF0470 protein C19orf51 n=1 Tax=Fasciola gigantica TaxID=46835 RepID=A0A504YXJ8_FASGI|nr:UPF0470 protein C19orf51 [Fasciola gigantica]